MGPGQLHPQPHPQTQPPKGFFVGQEPPCLLWENVWVQWACYFLHTDELGCVCPQYLGWAGGETRVHTVPSLRERGCHGQDP